MADWTETEQWLDPAFWRVLHRREAMQRARRLSQNGPAGTSSGDSTRKTPKKGTPDPASLSVFTAESAFPPIRDRVFTDELKTLARSIQLHRPAANDAAPTSSHNGERDKPGSEAAGYHHSFRFDDMAVPLDGLAATVARLYMDREGDLPASLLASWNRQYSAMASAILLFSRDEGAYRLVLSAGLDDEQKRNLWASARDPFFGQDGIQSFLVDPSLKQNPFFAKRFTVEFLASLNSIVSIPLDHRAVPSLLLFFFHTDPPELPTDEMLAALDWLHPLMVRRLQKESGSTLSRSIYDQAAREVRSFLNRADGAQLVQFHFGALTEAQLCNRFIYELRRLLSQQRHVLIMRMRPDGLKILLTPEASAQPLLATVTDLGKNYGIAVQSFQMAVRSDLVTSAVL